jgi:photosystem II stability/assembly factor-like uncharacterized protein
MARGTVDLRPRDARPSARRARRRAARRARWPWLVGGALALFVLAALAIYVKTAREARGEAISALHTADFHALAFSPQDPNVVFFGHHNGVMRSDDGGRAWRPLVDRPNFDAMGLGVSRNPHAIYLAGHDVFQVSVDGGTSWQPVAHNLPGTDIHGFAMSPDDARNLFAFVIGQGVFESTDAGRSWQRLIGQVPGQMPGDVMALAAAGGSPETLYAGSMRSGVLRSTDGGKSWAPSSNGLGSRAVMALAVDPSDAQTIYAGIEGGLSRSTDGGATWSKLPFPGDNAVALALSPTQPNVVLAITVKNREGLVYRSEDGGQSWTSRG